MNLNTPSMKYSLITTILLIAIIAAFPTMFTDGLTFIKTTVISKVGWIFSWPMFACTLVLIYLTFSKYGSYKFGGDEPEYSNFSWWGMIYSCGMGMALLTFSSLEHGWHTDSGFEFKEALILSYNHWAIGPYSLYTVVGLMFCYLCYVKKSSDPVAELVGKGKLAVMVNTVFTVCIVIGLALTFILTVFPVVDNFKLYTGLAVPPWLAIIILAAIAVASAATGIKKGVKWLSQYNAGIALFVLGVVVLQTDLVEIIKLMLTAIPEYVVRYPALQLDVGFGDPKQQDWLATWLYSYAASWVVWSVFTGVFVMRISKGRSVREIIVASLIVPSLISIAFFTVYPVASVELGTSSTVEIINMLGGYPVGCLLILNMVLFFATSADSAGIVCESLTVPGSRIVWILGMALTSVFISLIGDDALSVIRLLVTVSAIPVAFCVYYMMLVFVKRYLISSN